MLNKINRLTILTVYLGFTLFSLAIVISPGSSTFLVKKPIDSTQILPDKGIAFRYPLKVNTFLFSPKGLQVFEGKNQLSPKSFTKVSEAGQGTFYIAHPAEATYELYFASSDNSDPRANGKIYTLYMPVIFLSRSMGFVYLFLSILFLTWFFSFILNSPLHRQKVFSSPIGFLSIFDAFITIQIQVYFYPITNRKALEIHRHGIWKHLLWWIVLASFTYIVMEWLFFVTKPSFMDILRFDEKVTILLYTSTFVSMPALLLGLFLWGLDTLLERVKCSGLPLLLASLIPTALFALTGLLLVDNFTYTVFRFGIVTTTGFWRFVYAALFLFGFSRLHRRILLSLGLRGTTVKPFRLSRYPLYAVSGLFTVSLALVLVSLNLTSFTNNASARTSDTQNQSLPNIILLGSDGLNAANMSVYGYDRDTTPTMRKLAETSLLAENAFTNAAHSTGSVISIFNSKLPTQTRVLYPPDILQIKDSYQHLPGILKRAGYTTVEFGSKHFVDAYLSNVRNGFDIVNDRSLGERSWFQSAQGLGFDDSLYFLNLLAERISERLNHIFFIKGMENPFKMVTEPEENLVDRQRLNKLIDLINGSDKPFFVHVHMMATHGGKFNPRVEMFSSGKTQDKEWMTDFYDDTILAYDVYVSHVLEALESANEMDNTILILYTDHPQRWKVKMRIPLIIHFPYDWYAGRVRSNVQNLDIAPTILDYLDMDIPDWMGGQSLLHGELALNRLIFATGTNSTLLSRGNVDSRRIGPPFYQFTWFNIIQCNQWYYYDVLTSTWEYGEVPGHTSPCNSASLISIDDVQKTLMDHLDRNGFDISEIATTVNQSN